MRLNDGLEICGVKGKQEVSFSKGDHTRRRSTNSRDETRGHSGLGSWHGSREENCEGSEAGIDCDMEEDYNHSSRTGVP